MINLIDVLLILKLIRRKYLFFNLDFNLKWAQLNNKFLINKMLFQMIKQELLYNTQVENSVLELMLHHLKESLPLLISMDQNLSSFILAMI